MASSISESIIINASQNTIFAILTDINHWPDWDPEVVSTDFQKPVQQGATGKLKPKDAPKTTIKVTELTPDQSITIESKMPLCTLSFVHELNTHKNQTNSEKTRVTYDVFFDGLLAPIWQKLIGGGIQKGLAKTLAGLKQKAESTVS